ncbi:hypothetical protein NEHOM01_2154 [Nematocida homosporus]|uniref:uncharacterized protein n=1 Tax=Nematocida homosporus TaxID=1912981 RepID=UPI00221EE762|nr:uncharacterized protein NEHOM01_2154 [Nematocida homosporus]KAI5187409.1 hypothetical protein NEHOM01_2154 [Nematocida homosporus]
MSIKVTQHMSKSGNQDTKKSKVDLLDANGMPIEEEVVIQSELALKTRFESFVTVIDEEEQWLWKRSFGALIVLEWAMLLMMLHMLFESSGAWEKNMQTNTMFGCLALAVGILGAVYILLQMIRGFKALSYRRRLMREKGYGWKGVIGYYARYWAWGLLGGLLGFGLLNGFQLIGGAGGLVPYVCAMAVYLMGLVGLIWRLLVTAGKDKCIAERRGYQAAIAKHLVELVLVGLIISVCAMAIATPELRADLKLTL